MTSINALENPAVNPLPLEAEVAARPSNKKAYAQTFAATAVIRVFGALSGVFAARLLGRTGRGELAVIVFMPLMLLSLGEFEFSRSVVIESSRREAVPAELVATAFWVACIVGLLEATLLAGALRFVLPASKLYLLSSSRWFTLYLPACYVSASLTGIDQGKGRFGRFSLYQAMAGIIYVLLIMCVIWPMQHILPQTFAAAMLVGVVFTAALRAGQDWEAIFRTLPNWHLAQKLLRRGFSFYIPALAGLALLRADMFLLVRLAPAAAIGAYAVAQAISMGQVGAVIPFVQVGFAAVAAETKHERALETLLKHFRLSQVAVVTAALVAGALTPWGIRVFFGPEYLLATNTTYLLIAAAATWGIGETLEQGLRAAGHPGLGIASNIAGLVGLCGLGVPAYFYFGIAGLAAAAFLGQLVSLLALIGLCVLSLKMGVREFWAFDEITFRELRNLAVSIVRRFEKTQASVNR